MFINILISTYCIINIILTCHFKYYQENDLLIYLKDQIDSKEKELFLVVSKEIDNNQGWLINTYANKEGINADHDTITYIEDGYMEMNLKKDGSTEMNENEKSLDNKNSR